MRDTADGHTIALAGQGIFQKMGPGETLLKQPPATADGFCSGTLLLSVEPHQSFHRVSQFVHALRFDFRLLKIEGSYTDGLGIRLAPRQQLCPEEALTKLDEVSIADGPHPVDPASDEQTFRIRLKS